MGHREREEPTTQQVGVPEDSQSAVLAAVVDITVVLDETGVIRSLTEEGDPTLGLPTDPLVGEPVSSLFAPDAPSAPALEASSAVAFERAVLDPGRETVTAPLRAADGTVPMALTTAQRPGDGGQVCVGRELGGRSTGSRANTEPELFDDIPDPLYVLDASGRIEQVNAAFVNYTGYDRGQLLGRDFSEIMSAKSVADGSGDDETDDSGIGTFESTLVTRDGERIVTEANVAPLTDDEAARTVGVLRDIRDRKRREQNLDLLKQVMTRVFRHNVRNELMIATSHTHLVDEQTDGDVREHTATIREAADRLLAHSEKARLIEQVVENDSLSDLDLTDCVSAAVDRVREAHPTARVKTDIPERVVVEAHPNLGRAVEELVENAVEHAPDEDQAQVDIWLDRREGTETLFVEDESGGLADHETAVLERGAEQDLQHASGVGLWLVRWLVEYSGAELITHRTEGGSLMGIRFGTRPGRPGVEPDRESPLARAPAHVRDLSPKQFHGDTVIGRVDSLATLEDAYENLERTGGHAVLVTGEAGIGKTTLVEQFREQLACEEQSPVVASGVCPPDAQPPYHAFRQVVEGLPVGRELSELLADAGSLSTAGSGNLQHRKRAVFSEIADQLRGVATDQPVVLVVEDMQWADSGTVDVFEYLLDEVGSWRNPVLFVGTYRTSDVEQNSALFDIAEEMATTGRGTVLELEPFGRDEVASLLADLLGVEELPDSLVADLHEHTGGTPLFVNELGRHIAETVGPVRDGTELPADLSKIPVPETVERAIAERLESVPDSVWPVLCLGAVAGLEFSFDVLRAASDRHLDSLIECIDTLVASEVWMRSADEIQFVNGLVREQVLTTVDDDQLERLHETVAAALERVYPDQIEDHAGRLATHYERTGAYDTAFEYYRQAGEYAAESYATADAIQNYERALELASEHGLSDSATLATLYASLADVYQMTGEYETTVEVTQQGLEIAPERSQQRCRLLGNQMAAHREQSNLDEASAIAHDRLDLAETLNDEAAQARVNNGLGKIAEHRGEYDRAREYYRTALEVATEAGEQSVVCHVRHSLGVVAHRQGEYEQAATSLQQALDIVDNPFSRKAILNDLGLVAMNRGEYDRAHQYYQQSLDIAREIGDRRGEAIGVHNLGEIAQNQGRYERAREYYERSLEIERELGNRRGEAVSLQFLGAVALARDCNEHAEERYEQVLSIGQELDSQDIEASGLHGLGVLARKRGYYERAQTHLDHALRRRVAHDERHSAAKTRLESARLALERGEPGTARERTGRARESLQEIGATHTLGKSDLLYGTIADRAGNHTEARARWRDALGAFRDVTAPQDELTTLRRLVDNCLEQGDIQSAREWHEQAESALTDAPGAVAQRHQDWVEAHAAEL